MPTTLLTAMSRLRTSLGDINARTWTDIELANYLHDGASDIAKSTECLQATVEVEVDADTASYDLPADCIRVHRVDFQPDSYDHSVNLEITDFHNSVAVRYVNSTSGMPAICTMWGVPGAVKVILYPTPAYTGTLFVHYYRLPTRATIPSDPLDIPEGWDNTVVHYAEAVALRRDRQPQWQEAMQMYQAELSALYDLTRRHTDQSGQVVGTNGEPFWLYDMGDGY